MADFAHYMRRDIIQTNYQDPCDPWFSENQPEEQGFANPAYHVTRKSNGPAARVSKGDTIWLFAQLFSPWGKLPPALDARIEIGSVEDRESGNGFRFGAAQGSCWFPLFDASACISNLKTKTVAGKTTNLLSNPSQSIGQALQSIRELHNPNVIEHFASKLLQGDFHFVSYRLVDGTRSAFEKTLDLVSKKRAVFWDRWSLPRRVAERREFLNDDALDSYIVEQIKKASVVWGIDSPLYGADKSYSKRELDLASRQEKLRMHVCSRRK